MMDKFLPQVAAVSAQQQQQQQQQVAQTQSSKSFSVSEEHRHYLKVFIQTYHNLPILWDTSLRDYTNRDKRADAYQTLVPIYRYLKRDATLEDVKKKINTLRTNYRKELKVVEAARKQGNHYQPRCWTFYELDFLRNAEKFLAIDTSIIKHETSSSSTTPSAYNTFSESAHAGHFLDNAPYGYLMGKGNTSPMSITEMFHKSFGQQNNNNNNQQQRVEANSNHTTPPLGLPGGIQSHLNVPTNTTPYQTPTAAVSANANKRLKTTTSSSPPDEMLNMACDYLSSTYPEEESIARTWTHKLKRLPREQRLLAEKFINDILFEAESGSLHRGSMQLNALEPYVRFEESQNDDSSQEKPQSPNVLTNNTTSTNATQSLEQTPNETNTTHHSPLAVGNMLINDGSTASASNDTDNNSRNTSAFSSYN
ncbi:uncharacterized protein LOC119604196 [Lucilia sericata]|uniref:uncharacterized protein LOC119604196 n=1 Tax=Lucilia sericata TaxID=13632 RepID=UPI0018A82924|nr:uncharacterized protein LOC119604196 [Lucilia sericata]